ncbi:hypothetical protein [Asanoa hainanensis]|uniref:hypothetical protein n=1 Tax=Asanoa hainanensis TaxID=560556 RepID=UPI0015C64B6A|nr:hypothetical protein [Asanoa hainanensis]
MSNLPPVLVRLYERFLASGFTVLSATTGGMDGCEIILRGRVHRDVPAELNLSSDRFHALVTVRPGDLERGSGSCATSRLGHAPYVGLRSPLGQW